MKCGTCTHDHHRIHIWSAKTNDGEPGSGAALISLPRPTGRLAGALALPAEGPHSFAALSDTAAYPGGFAEGFAALFPHLRAQWSDAEWARLCAEVEARPVRHSSTVTCNTFVHGRVALVSGPQK
jgi:hypothetical protein